MAPGNGNGRAVPRSSTSFALRQGDRHCAGPSNRLWRRTPDTVPGHRWGAGLGRTGQSAPATSPQRSAGRFSPEGTWSAAGANGSAASCSAPPGRNLIAHSACLAVVVRVRCACPGIHPPWPRPRWRRGCPHVFSVRSHDRSGGPSGPRAIAVVSTRSRRLSSIFRIITMSPNSSSSENATAGDSHR